MRNFATTLFAIAIGLTSAAWAEDAKAEKVTADQLPAAVKEGFAAEVKGGEITSIKKLGGDKPRYQIHYKAEGKEHQITLGDDGKPTKHHKDEKEAETK
jgi:hypothetical protein